VPKYKCNTYITILFLVIASVEKLKLLRLELYEISTFKQLGPRKRAIFYVLAII
jgi:hypothetical protein